MITATFIVQSCQIDDDVSSKKESELALERFNTEMHEKVIETNKLIKTFQLQKNNIEKEKTSKNNTQYKEILENIQNKTEIEAKAILEPLVLSAKELLLTYGITDSDLAKEFIDTNDPRIAIIGMHISVIEEHYNTHNVSKSIDIAAIMGVQNMHAQSAVDCALRATGIKGIANIFKDGIKKTIKLNGKRYILNILGKSLGRTLGWIGVRIAVYHFADCMGWTASLVTVKDVDCSKDLLIVGLKNSNHKHLISKNSIDYISENNYKIPTTSRRAINTYKVDFGNIALESLTRDTNCFVKLASSIDPINIDINSIKEYDPYQILDDGLLNPVIDKDSNPSIFSNMP